MTDQLRLFDTLSGTIRPFVPAESEVKLYVCGVTPYDTAHLGHAFTYVAFDVLIRYLRYLGSSVRYVQNVTDVDDPLFERAHELGISYVDLAASETDRYLADMRALNVLPADLYPRASAEVAGMIRLADRLLEAGHAYTADGHVYFRIASDPSYGQLSKYDRATMIGLARERGGDPDDPLKRDPLDFLLWRPSRGDEPRNPSPWGEGLPGWHLECSTMSLKHLGAPLDIHGGGTDLIYPHHESEIAQSEGATGTHPFARFWMHTAMVHMDGEKMSKSLGNMVFAGDLIAQYGSDAVRLYVSGCHYRSELHWNPGVLERAAGLAAELANASAAAGGEAPSVLDLEEFRRHFEERLNDDLDTPGAIHVLLELAAAIKGEAGDAVDVRDAQALLRELGGVLGLSLHSFDR